jgi:plastocyanin
MRIPRSIRLAAAAALGAAVVVLPAAAASEGTPTIENEDPARHWKPPAVTIEPNGSITFKNTNAGVKHGVEWTGGPATPSCEPSVPVNSAATSWSGNCTFATSGTYTFRCTEHPSTMKGTITVTTGAGKEPPKEPTPTGTTTVTTPGAPPPPSGGGSGSGGSQSGGAQAGTPVSASAALAALKLSVPRHGATVRGSLTIPSAGAGGRLEVDLLAKLGSSKVRVGQLVRRSIAAGPLRFSLAPTGRGLRALRKRGSLKVTMLVKLAPLSGTASSVSRALTLRR